MKLKNVVTTKQEKLISEKVIILLCFFDFPMLGKVLIYMINPFPSEGFPVDRVKSNIYRWHLRE